MSIDHVIDQLGWVYILPWRGPIRGVWVSRIPLTFSHIPLIVQSRISKLRVEHPNISISNIPYPYNLGWLAQISCMFSGGLTSQRIETLEKWCVNSANLSNKSLLLHFLLCALRWYTTLFKIHFVIGSLTRISFGHFLTAFWTIWAVFRLCK